MLLLTLTDRPQASESVIGQDGQAATTLLDYVRGNIHFASSGMFNLRHLR